MFPTSQVVETRLKPELPYQTHLIMLCALLLLVGSTRGQAITLTQSSDNVTITPGQSVSCRSQAGHADNSYFRFYNGSALPGPVQITAVEFGIETAISGSGTQPATVNIYSTPAGSTAITSFTLLSSEGITIADGSLVRQRAPLTVPVHLDANPAEDIVVELFTPNGQAFGNTLYLGANGAGQSAPTFIAAPGCGIPNPTNVAALGFPSMHAILDLVVDAPLRYAGTLDGLITSIGVNASASPIDLENQVSVVPPTSTVNFGIMDAYGDLTGIGDYVVLASIVNSGSVIPEVAPDLYVGGAVVVVVDSPSAFGLPSVLPPTGSFLSFTYPGGLAGLDVILQAFVVTPGARNSIYASSTAATMQLN